MQDGQTGQRSDGHVVALDGLRFLAAGAVLGSILWLRIYQRKASSSSI